MVLDMTGFSAAEDWNCLLRSGGPNQAREVMAEHLGNSEYDAEVTLEKASCPTNPAIVIDSGDSYAQTG